MDARVYQGVGTWMSHELEQRQPSMKDMNKIDATSSIIQIIYLGMSVDEILKRG
jgi:hypothetical protein